MQRPSRWFRCGRRRDESGTVAHAYRSRIHAPGAVVVGVAREPAVRSGRARASDNPVMDVPRWSVKPCQARPFGISVCLPRRKPSGGDRATDVSPGLRGTYTPALLKSLKDTWRSLAREPRNAELTGLDRKGKRIVALKRGNETGFGPKIGYARYAIPTVVFTASFFFTYGVSQTRR